MPVPNASTGRAPFTHPQCFYGSSLIVFSIFPKKIRATRFNPRRPLLIDSRSCCFSLPSTRFRFGFTRPARCELSRKAPLAGAFPDLGSVLSRPHLEKFLQALRFRSRSRRPGLTRTTANPAAKLIPPSHTRAFARFDPRSFPHIELWRFSPEPHPPSRFGFTLTLPPDEIPKFALLIQLETATRFDPRCLLGIDS